jgi:hypothetical protein
MILLVLMIMKCIFDRAHIARQIVLVRSKDQGGKKLTKKITHIHSYFVSNPRFSPKQNQIQLPNKKSPPLGKR